MRLRDFPTDKSCHYDGATPAHAIDCLADDVAERAITVVADALERHAT